LQALVYCNQQIGDSSQICSGERIVEKTEPHISLQPLKELVAKIKQLNIKN